MCNGISSDHFMIKPMLSFRSVTFHLIERGVLFKFLSFKCKVLSVSPQQTHFVSYNYNTCGCPHPIMVLF